MLASTQIHLFFRAVKAPFANLSTGHIVLAALRIGSSFLTVCLIVTAYILLRFPTTLYIARINTGHLDVAMGLYRSLRSLLTASVLNNGAKKNVLPIDLGLSDSEIMLLTKYTHMRVSNAPQSFILAPLKWCTVDYATDFSHKYNVHTNVTTTCQKYSSFNFYDYREMLLANQLAIIIAYAYENNGTEDHRYKRRVRSRFHKYHVMTIIYALQLWQQVFLTIAGLVIYCKRGKSPDLSDVSKTALNVVGAIALISGVTMTVATVTTVSDLYHTQREIQQGLGLYGIRMTMGMLYIALAWLAFASACLGMFLWVVPLWCSNPAGSTDTCDEEVYPVNNNRTTSHLNETSSVALSQLQLQSLSRLFDHVDHLLHSAGIFTPRIPTT